jgi:hypothetical protein
MISFNEISVSKFEIQIFTEEELTIENGNSTTLGRIQNARDWNDCCCSFFELMKNDYSLFKMSFVSASDSLIELDGISEHRVASYDCVVILCENAGRKRKR